MLKRFTRLAAVSAVALLAGLNAAQAGPAVNQPDGSLFKPLTGLYIGGYGGYDWADLDTSGGLPNPKPRGVDYGGFVGYSFDALLSRYSGIGLTAAVEGHYGFSNSRDSDSIFGVGVTTKKRNEWGVDFRPGLSVINQYVAPVGLKPYAIVGYDRTKFAASSAFGGASAHYNGFALGAGTELFTFEHIGLRADYEHVWYQDNNGARPDENLVRLGAALHF